MLNELVWLRMIFKNDLSLTDHALKHFAISKASSTNSQHKRHKIYTGSGHRCGVIPYSTVWWWIASWAVDEQYKGKNSLMRLRCSCARLTCVGEMPLNELSDAPYCGR